MSEYVKVYTSEDLKPDKLSGLTLVDFWATWCGPCRMIAPFVEQLADEYEGKVAFMKVNVDEEPALCEKYRVSSIPNLVLFKDGDVVDSSAGARPKAQLAAFIEQVL